MGGLDHDVAAPPVPPCPPVPLPLEPPLGTCFFSFFLSSMYVCLTLFLSKEKESSLQALSSG